MLRRQFASGYFFEKTIFHCLIFREDNCPLLRRQLYSAQFMVKITVFREDNQPVLHLQRRQSASASHFEKTIVPVLKKTILLEKTILPFPYVKVRKSQKQIFVFPFPPNNEQNNTYFSLSFFRAELGKYFVSSFGGNENKLICL